MKTIAALTTAVLGVAALAAASRRIATHQAVLPELSSHVNTRVIRINQQQPAPPARGTGSLPEPQGDELP